MTPSTAPSTAPSIAPSIAAAIASQCSSAAYVAVTLSGGYAVHGDGSRDHFEVGRGIALRRNEKGRVTYACYGYSDGSHLELTYSENRGSRFSAKPSGRADRVPA